MPTRIPIRDSAGTLLEYKLDEDGERGPDPAAGRHAARHRRCGEGTLVPSELPDQAGAVRDLVAAMKRSPSRETRTADLVPRALDPGARRRAAAPGYTWRAPGPALVGLAGLLLVRLAPRPSARRRGAAHGGGRSRRARRPSSSRRPAGAPRATRRSTTRAPRRSRPGDSTSRAGRCRRPPSRSTPASATARSTISGLVGLLAAEADTSQAEELLDEAADRLREALLLAAVVGAGQVESRAGRAPPAAAAARWRRRWRRRDRRPAVAAAGQPPAAAERPSQGLTQSQAEQILNSMERRERETRAEQQRRLQDRLGGGSEGLVIALAARWRCSRPSRPSSTCQVDQDRVAVGEEILYTLRAASHSPAPMELTVAPVQRLRDRLSQRTHRGLRSARRRRAPRCWRSGCGRCGRAAGSSARLGRSGP